MIHSFRLIIIFILTFCFVSEAKGSLKNFPGKGKFNFGIESISITEKEIWEYDDQYTDTLTSDQLLVTFSYGLIKNLSVDLKFGKGKFTISPEDNPWLFDQGFAWGLGIRTKIYENPHKLKVNLGFQHMFFYPEEFQKGSLTFETKPKEWEISLVTEKISSLFSLYSGVKYGEFVLAYEHPSIYGTRKGGFAGNKNVGVFIGGGINLRENFSLSIEKHFLKEESFLLKANYNF